VDLSSGLVRQAPIARGALPSASLLRHRNFESI